MKKFLYYYGVYHFCVGVHHMIDYILSDRFMNDCRKNINEAKGIFQGTEKKEEEKPKLRSAHIVKNRIGF